MSDAVTGYLVARDGNGRWHGCAPVPSRAAEAFRATHEANSCTVERLTPEQVVALIAPKGQGSAPTVDLPADVWQPRPIDEARLREIHAAVAREFAGREGLDRPVPIAVAAAGRYAHEHCELPEPDLGNGWIDLAVARGRPKVEREAQLLLGLPELQRAAALPRRAEPAPPVVEASASNIVAPAVDPQAAAVAEPHGSVIGGAAPFDYETFLAAKVAEAAPQGFGADPATLHPALLPFQHSIVTLALSRGRSAVFAERGLGKTLISLAWSVAVVARTSGRVLIFAPLAVALQVVTEGEKWGVGVTYVRSQAEADAAPTAVVVTNYERLAAFEPRRFKGVVLNEASVLKQFMGKTKRALVEACRGVHFKLVETATPAPNDLPELLNYAEFLELMDPSEGLTRWFINDTKESQKFRLKKHARAPFWAWVASWAVCLALPSDLGPQYSDEGYVLPRLTLVEHVLPVDHGAAAEDGALFRTGVVNATSLHAELRRTMHVRAQKVAELVAERPDVPWCVWVNTNAEADAVMALLPGAVEVRGDQTPEEKERRLMGFVRGEFLTLVTKAEIAGWGMNFQHCRHTAFMGLDFSFEAFYQAIGRFHRFGQTGEVTAHVIVAETEVGVRGVVARKQEEHHTMQREMIQAMGAPAEAARALALDTGDYGTVTGEGWTLHHGDCCVVTRKLLTASVGLSVFSPPFSTLYSYSASLHDMGNTDDDGHFFKHFGYLIPELRRVTIPGRLVVVHVKNLPIYKSKSGYTGVRDFRGDVIRAFTECSPGEDGAIWSYHSEVCIWTDPVREMQRTKRQGLLYSQLRRDASHTTVGMPEYLLVFRKWTPECDAPAPVTHTTEDLPLDLWQRYASPVWFDIQRTDVLNAKVARADEDEKHLAPLQLEVIRRAVHLWSNPGDLVFTPFLGIGSEAVTAVQMGRRAEGIELKKEYFDWAVRNVREAAEQRASRLFDLVGAD